MFWKKSFTGATALFLLNRYLLVLSSTLVVVGEGITSVKVCTVIVDTQFAIYFAQYLPWAAFAAMRAYALGGRHWPLAVTVLLLGLVPYGINMIQYGKGLTGIVDPIVGCASITPGLSPELGQRFTIVSRTTQIALDLLLVGITWRTIPRQGHGMGSSSFTAVVLRHGNVMLVLNTLHLALTLVSIEVVPSTPASIITLFTLPLTAILVSRFLLDLQYANREAVHLHSGDRREDASSADSAHDTSSINFERIVGSLGSTMMAEPLAESDDDELTAECDNAELAGSINNQERGGIGGFPVPVDRRG
ncbi:hypothetical protein L226DRAFT_517059 [Lentinus tigrinus ALCF2SS1-7]|uniref:uncharacterized protein n=1 Tax=Lentinus tigrinus ALCF2SS1-7 TaxID=1328758 RepID=UPI001165F17F|nr:hypothetical protein L226DRAFT_517059 [Lentinus tigrinus ALCF2SS1-7]